MSKYFMFLLFERAFFKIYNPIVHCVSQTVCVTAPEHQSKTPCCQTFHHKHYASPPVYFLMYDQLGGFILEINP